LSLLFYNDKKLALKAKECCVCEKKIDGAYVVATLHGDSKLGGVKSKHFPLCSDDCLVVFRHVLADFN